MDIFNLPRIVQSCGFGTNENIKLYRHGNVSRAIERHEQSFEEIYRAGDLDLFQAVQSSRQLGDDLVGFFLPETGRLARFVGFRKVLACYPWSHQSEAANQSRQKGYLREEGVWHELEIENRGSELVDRLVVDWPEGRSHHRWLFKNGDVYDSFPVREIRAKGVTRPFPGFDDLIISFSELQSLVNNDAGGWTEALSSTRGVYLITDRSNGDLYVGSATSARGIWDRWSAYSKSVHGGNRLMIDGLAGKTLIPDNLQFSILETLSNLASRDDGLRAEIRWKTKLGRRAITLNAN